MGHKESPTSARYLGAHLRDFAADQLIVREPRYRAHSAKAPILGSDRSISTVSVADTDVGAETFSRSAK